MHRAPQPSGRSAIQQHINKTWKVLLPTVKAWWTSQAASKRQALLQVGRREQAGRVRGLVRLGEVHLQQLFALTVHGLAQDSRGLSHHHVAILRQRQKFTLVCVGGGYNFGNFCKVNYCKVPNYSFCPSVRPSVNNFWDIRFEDQRVAAYHPERALIKQTAKLTV